MKDSMPTKRNRLKHSIRKWLNNNARDVVALPGNNLRFLSKENRKKSDVVFAAVRKTGNALRFAPEGLQKDRPIVLEAVQQNGNALRFASEELRSDREIVLEAVKQNGNALRFASEALQSDNEIVLTKDGMALERLPESVKEDVDLVQVAVIQNGKALQFAQGAAREDYGVQLASFLREPSVFVAVFRKEPEVIEAFLISLKERCKHWVIEAVERCGELLAFVNPEHDMEFALDLARAAVAKDANALQFVQDRIIQEEAQALLEDPSVFVAAWRKDPDDFPLMKELMKVPSLRTPSMTEKVTEAVERCRELLAFEPELQEKLQLENLSGA